jgi:hypothetical protein
MREQHWDSQLSQSMSTSEYLASANLSFIIGVDTPLEAEPKLHFEPDSEGESVSRVTLGKYSCTFSYNCAKSRLLG